MQSADGAVAARATLAGEMTDAPSLRRPHPRPVDPRARPVRSRAHRLALVVVLVSALAACSADGPASAGGRVVGSARDADTGEAIAEAWIFEVHRDPGSGADVLRVDRMRTARTDDRGAFSFEAESPGLGLGRRYAPIYHFFHPSYGLLRVRVDDARGRVEIRPSLRDAHLRLADAFAFCRAGDDDPLAKAMRALACPPARVERFPDGAPRATGPRDARGRRDGEWTFFRDDGSVIAHGHYRAGAATGRWTFEPPAANATIEAPDAEARTDDGR